MVRVYDRPLLRSSARGDGALKANRDRFAIGLLASDGFHVTLFKHHEYSAARGQP